MQITSVLQIIREEKLEIKSNDHFGLTTIPIIIGKISSLNGGGQRPTVGRMYIG